MTKKDTADILEALNNGWEDRLFQFHKIWINSEVIRPQDSETFNNEIVAPLRKLVAPKIFKIEDKVEEVKTK
jgi:hypothetical protein